MIDTVQARCVLCEWLATPVPPLFKATAIQEGDRLDVTLSGQPRMSYADFKRMIDQGPLCRGHRARREGRPA